ncbi:hypothetical protein, partial [Pseudoalteromonas sp. 2CM28B]|uniref:hypothetical protein n=1 Tax=Pseudoalteromonas sp. 2CM28B TaxID=2929851 RepID=UPI0020C0C599
YWTKLDFYLKHRNKFNFFSVRLSLKAALRAFTLTRFGAKASYIYNLPLDKNDFDRPSADRSYPNSFVAS